MVVQPLAWASVRGPLLSVVSTPSWPTFLSDDLRSLLHRLTRTAETAPARAPT